MVKVDLRYYRAQRPKDGPVVTVDELVSMVAEEGLDVGNVDAPDAVAGGGGDALAYAAAIWVFLKLGPEKFIEGFASALGQDAWNGIKSIYRRVRRHRSPQLANAQFFIGIDVSESQRIWITMFDENRIAVEDATLDELANVRLPPIRQGDRVWSVQWNSEAHAWRRDPLSQVDNYLSW